MKKIPVPSGGNNEQRIALAGVTFTFYFSYNETTKHYSLSVFKDGRLLVAGLKLMEGSLLWNKYSIDALSIGEIFVTKMKETDEPVGRHNLGLGKEYELIFVPYI